MDYTYSYIAGGMAIVDVDADWVDKLNAFEAEERANDLKHTRSRYRVYLTNLPQGLDQIVGHEPNPLQMLCTAEAYQEMFRKLDTLTPRQIEVLAKRLEGMSSRAIAESLGVSQTAIENCLKYVRKKFS